MGDFNESLYDGEQQTLIKFFLELNLVNPLDAIMSTDRNTPTFIMANTELITSLLTNI